MSPEKTWTIYLASCFSKKTAVNLDSINVLNGNALTGYLTKHIRCRANSAIR